MFQEQNPNPTASSLNLFNDEKKKLKDSLRKKFTRNIFHEQKALEKTQVL